ncbi:MAG: PPC domain-containing protein [Planctomycetes bacterium]|nr:PPC domain-containing protein [Planctomycetota bacterium]
MMPNFPVLAYWTVLSVALLASAPVVTSAAPPKLDYLFPAGAQRGTTVEITAAGTFDRWPVKVHVEGDGVDVKPGKASGKLAITVAKDAPPGVCWIRLHDVDGASVARPFFVGMLPEVLEQEPNDDPKKPQVLDQSSVVVNGRLAKPGDVDTFAVKLTKGQTLVASVEANRTLRSPMDGVLQILSTDGFVLDQNDDYHGLDPQIAFTAAKDGTYLVRLFAFPAMADATVRFAGKENFVYRLTLTTGPYVEYAYPLSVAKSGPCDVELIGWNLTDDLRRFRVTPRDGGKSLTLFDPRIANPFLVQVEPHACLVKSKDRPQKIEMPVTVTGRLDKPGDADEYQVTAKKGAKLSFRVNARTLGSPLDPVLRLSDGAGKTLLQTKAAAIGADASLDYTAPQDGIYRLEVSDLHRDGGFRYVYRLHAGPIPPDFELKVAGDAFVLMPNKPLEIPVAVTRVGGFNQDVTLSVEGAPKHITVTATAKTITLRLEKGPPFAGPIRIVGTSKDGARRTAHATVTEVARTTDSLWLTVSAK